MKKIIIISLCMIALYLVNCTKERVMEPESDIQVSQLNFDVNDMDTYRAALIRGDEAQANEIRLKYYAKAIAKSLENPEVCRILKEEIGMKFDGDYDVLWERVKEKTISRKVSFKHLIEGLFSQSENQFLSLPDIEKVPLLQISLPVNYDKWDGESPILVAYTPLTIDDTEWEEIYAYDSDGNEYVFKAGKVPDFPVLVVGVNERCDLNGRLLFEKNGIMRGINNLQWEKLYEVKSRNYHEPGWKGDPEVWFQVAGLNNGEQTVTTLKSLEGVFHTKLKWDGWHYDHKWHTLNRNIELRDPSKYG